MGEKRTALLAGATGLVGRHVLEFLIADSVYGKITVLARRKTGVESSILEEKILDFSNLEDSHIPEGTTDVFCCLGTTMAKAGSRDQFYEVDFEHCIRLAQIAKRKQVRNFLVVSAMGADSDSLFYYNRVKGEMEEALSALNFPYLGIFRPSLLEGDRKEFRFGEQIALAVSRVFVPAFIGPLQKFAPVKASAVAFSMVHEAKKNRSGIEVFESDVIQKIYTEFGHGK